MASDDRGRLAADDAAFERMLLGSARMDELPEGATRAAWSKFASAAGALAAAPRPETAGELGGSVLRGGRAAALQWLALGGLAGSIVTAMLMSSVRQAQGPHAAAAGGAPAVQISAASPPAAAPPAATASSAPSLAALENASAATRRRLAPAPAKASPSSTLAAEIKALDAVRTAIAIGAFESALQLVDDFHQTFPAGQLGTDAEALAIEALAERGDAREAARRAARFLSRYPNDPHAARIRALSAR